MSNSICRCSRPIHPMRIEFGFDTCIDCADELNIPPPKGRMVYTDKCAPTIEIMSAETWSENKSRFMPRGARSAVKNFSKNISV